METENVILEENQLHLTKELLKTVSTCCFCGTFQPAAKLGHRKRTATFKEAVESAESFHFVGKQLWVPRVEVRLWFHAKVGRFGLETPLSSVEEFAAVVLPYQHL